MQLRVAILIAILAVVGCHSAPSLRAPAAAEAVLGYRIPPPADPTITGFGPLGTGVERALQRGYHDQVEHAPPVSLATDGSELALRWLTADIQIYGPLAHTELHFTFHNAESRIREGRFTVGLPPGAAVSRFAMKVGDTWREARIVARSQGRAVYETYLHRRVDPALLERDADHRFSARVFPIAAGADKEIIIAYDHMVGAGMPYVLPLRGLPAVPLAMVIDQDGVRHSRATRDAPDDVVLAIAPGDAAVGAEDDDLAFVARIDPPAATEPAALDRVLVLVDTSASRAAVMAHQAEALRRLLDRLPATAEVAVAAFDHTVEPLYRGPARDGHAAADAILEHGALGASRLAEALRYATTAGMARVVLIGDAVATLGESDPARLAEIVTGSPNERIDVIQLGQAIDLDAARAITGAARSPGAILDGRDLDRAARQLALAVPEAQPIAVSGATTWPATTRGVAPGDPIFVYGIYSAQGPDVAPPLAVTIGHRVIRLAPERCDPARVRRAVASAQLAVLGEALAAATDPDVGQHLRAEIERIALAHGVVSSQTSLLTLESDADEERMLGPRRGPAEPPPPAEAATPAPPADATPTLSDAELIKLAQSEAQTEVITVTGSLVGGSAATGTSYWDGAQDRNVPGALWNPYLADSPHWGEPSPQRPSIIQHRDRTPWEPPTAIALLPPPPPAYRPPYTGALRDVMESIARHDTAAAVERAVRARIEAPQDVAAILALGEALEARGAIALAARAYGSLIDLFPSRDDLVRAAGERFDRMGAPARELAVDAYRRALHERPDRAVTYRRLGYTLAQLGRWTDALDVLVDALPRVARPSVTRILQEDIGLVAAAAIAADRAHAAPIRERLAHLHIELPTVPSLRFVLSWETDANDVDLHVIDRDGEEAFYGHLALASGGALLEDITDGFGPEMLSIDQPKAFPYRLAVHYYARGPEGVGIGAVQIVHHDGRGHLTIEDRPFVLQVDDATIDIGAVVR